MTSLIKNSLPLWIGQLKDPQFLVRAGAARALALVIYEYDEVIPPLIMCLGDPIPVVKAEAENSLMQARVDALVPALQEALSNSDYPVRSGAAHLLGRMGNITAIPTELVIPFYIDEVKNGTDWTRWAAVSFLGEHGPAAVNAVPPLIEALRTDKNNRLRAKAAWALGQIGPGGKDAIPALKQAMEDEYKNVREAAAEALKKIQPAGAEQ